MSSPSLAKPSKTVSPFGMANEVPLYQATADRCSTIDLKKESPISITRIAAIVDHSVFYAPTPFPVQTTRAIILHSEDHEALWDMAYECSRLRSPPPIFHRIVPDMRAFRKSFGTIIFFEDPQNAVGIPVHTPDTMIKIFHGWHSECRCIAQYVTWTAFCAEGLGCSLQHYVWPEFALLVRAKWCLPTQWVMCAQIVFGTPNVRPYKKMEE